MGPEWAPLVLTGVTVLYAVGILFKVIYDKHVFEAEERRRGRSTRAYLRDEEH